MADYKIDTFFALDNQGWSESFYMPATDPDTCYNQYLAVYQARAAILADPCKVVALRISDIAISRDSTLFTIPSAPLFPGTNLADRVGNARRIRMENNSIYWRHLLLRGIPDEVFDRANPGNATKVAWVAAANLWIKAITGVAPYNPSRTCYIRVAFKPPPPEVKVMGFLPDPVNPGVQLVTTDIALAVNLGDIVTFYNMRGFLPKIHKAQVVGLPVGGTFKIRYSQEEAAPLSPSARVKKEVFVLVPIQTVSDLGQTHRNTGRPFGQQLGRRRRTG